MSGWYVWTNRDTGVAGWVRDETNSSPQNPVLDDQLLPLMTVRFPQLEPLNINGIHSTSGTPIATAAWLQKIERWAFVLRGVGGVFGAAGTTQACLAPSGIGLAEAWPQFWAAVNMDERVDPELLGVRERALSAGSRLPDGVVYTTLGLLAADAPIVEAPVAPADTIRLYAEITRIIPESSARGLYWSTCHVAGSVMTDERIVTGRWPELLTEAWPRDYRRLTVGERYTTCDNLGTPPYEVAAALGWLLAESAHGRFPLAASEASTVSEALSDASRMRPLSVADVEEFARDGRPTAAQLDKLANNPAMMRQFSIRTPDLAQRLLKQTQPGSPLHSMLSLGVILSDHAPRGMIQELRSEVAQTRGPLTRGIQPYMVRGDNRRVAYAVLADDRGDDAALLGAKDWLLCLGLTSQDAPELFVFDPIEVARGAYRDPEAAAALIAEQRDLWQRLGSVLVRMDPAHPSTMRLLALATANDPGPGMIESVLVAIRPSPDEALHMTNNLSHALDRTSDDASHRDLMTFGFANWLHTQGVPLGPDLAVALIGLGTGIDPSDFRFHGDSAAEVRTRMADSVRDLPVPGRLSNERSARSYSIWRKTLFVAIIIASVAVGILMLYLLLLFLGGA